ncbi:MAG: endonuclease III [Thermoproteota archaeon]|nr:MAG: endonuclease III [Candidatus Korarchaeota archaeon]
MNSSNILEVLEKVRAAVAEYSEPAVSAAADRDPFKVLIATILSARTKDEVTVEAARRLFSKASTPHDMLKLSAEEISKLIYPVGFYRSKAKAILEVCRALVEEHGGKVPDSMEELLKLKGVGRKTANLVLSLGYGKPAICVDTHVHRITNRWGLVSTKTPEETERALMEKIPREHWSEVNRLLVVFGQRICRPARPLCGRCPIADICPKIGVEEGRKRRSRR